jgi:hypothetical protein
MEKRTYYLQYNDGIPHRMIDTVKNTGYLVENSVDAESWVQAKKLLGYPLTDNQEMILEPL